MIPILVVAVSTVLAVAAVGVSLFAVWRSQALVLLADQRARAAEEECAAGNEALRRVVESLSVQVRDLEHVAQSAAPGTAPKHGLNLSKRSQALRMHRKGDPPDQIASALGVPLQEVDLLIKVHRIVISNV